MQAERQGGAVLWGPLGISTQPRSIRHLESLEEKLGRPFDMVYHSNDIGGAFSSAVRRQEVEDGRLLHVAIAAGNFHRSRGTDVSWAEVVNGTYDSSLIAQAGGAASLRKPVFVTAAWRHLQTVGATNAVWTWVMTVSGMNLGRALSLWPGNDVVDWISRNVYNGSGCAIFYDFVNERGAAFGPDASEPMMISEAGSVTYPVDGSLAADWYVLRVALFDGGPVGFVDDGCFRRGGLV